MPKKFLYFSIFLPSKPKILLNFSFLYLLIMTHNFQSYISLFFIITLTKNSPSYTNQISTLFPFLYSLHFLSLSHQKITTIKILSVLKKPLIWSSKIAKKPTFISPPNFHRTIYHLSYPKIASLQKDLLIIHPNTF